MPDVHAWLEELRTAWPAGHWAVTGEAAADLRAPFLTRITRVELYLAPATYDDALAELLARVDLVPWTTGARVRVVRAYPYLARRIATTSPQDDVPLVPDVRLYADLLTGGVRADQAASELRDRRIGF